jgi:peptidoglycan/LPS O-acetylase OafA/YrhL
LIADIAQYGYLGVEFFFMVSGYVIIFSSDGRTASEFAVARALRLYPAFLFGVVVTTCVVLIWGSEKNSIYLSQFLTNLTMLAPLFRREFVDGSYWTLVLELYFYFLIFTFLFFGLSKQIGKFILAWPILILVANFLGGSKWPLVGGYYSYFAAGALFAMSRSNKNNAITFALLVCLYDSLIFSANADWIIVPIISAFYFFFFLLNTDKAHDLKLPSARIVGVITYPLYLVHQKIGYTIINRYANEQNKFYIIMLTIAGMIAFSFLIHQNVEYRLKGCWRNFFEKRFGALILNAEITLADIRTKLKAG